MNKEAIHTRLIKKVQAVTQGKPVPAENQGATVLKKPYKISIPKPKAKKTMRSNK
jgi:hypothetical protein